MYASFAFGVDEDLRDAAEVLHDRCCRLSLRAAGLPDLHARNLPSCVNFRMCASVPPLPPIQTLPLWSTKMPWFDSGHS